MPRTSKPTTKRAPAKRKTTKMRKGKGPTLAAQLALFNALLEDIITAIAGLEQSNAQRHKALLDRLPPKPTLAHALEGAAAFREAAEPLIRRQRDTIPPDMRQPTEGKTLQRDAE